MKKKSLSDRLQTAGGVIGILAFLTWLVITVYQLTIDNLGGWVYLLPAFIMLFLLLVARQKSVLGGVLLCGFGLVIGARYLDASGEAQEQLMILLLTGGPFVLVGVLFLLSGIRSLQTKKP